MLPKARLRGLLSYKRYVFDFVAQSYALFSKSKKARLEALRFLHLGDVLRYRMLLILSIKEYGRMPVPQNN